MKKLLLLSAFLIFACSSDDSNNSNDNNNSDDLIVGSWVLVNEEIVGNDWINSGSCRGCFMAGDEGEPDIWIFTATQSTKTYWECFPEDGSLCSGPETFGPESWANIDGVYELYYNDATTGELFTEILPINFINNDQFQIPYDIDITQTWERTN
tara:strand:+ start:536 stop:997 length:462 start_codon:yes stop_codon:yes gene_type:complete